MPANSLNPLSQALALGVIFLLVNVIPKLFRWHVRMRKLNAIPTVGSSGFLTSYISARRFDKHAKEILEEGYQKYPGQAFKVPLPDRWEVMVSGKDMVEDMRKASEQELSFAEAVVETLQTDYTMGPAARIDTYHIDVVRTPLTRNLGARFHDLRDEIELVFADQIPTKGSEWSKVPMLYTVMQIVSRTSNRVFVGTPICRNQDYINLNIQYTVDAFMGAQTLRRYPDWLKPFVYRFLTNVPASVKRATKHLKPIIQDRLQKEEEYGSSDWPDKPNDLISWILDEAQGERRSGDIVYNIVSRVLLVNFGAIHTTSMTLTSTLFRLAANPEFAQPLREEVESAVNELGWTKAAMGKMRKLDSFMKETQRLGGLGGLSMVRMALKDFTFSNGTVIPAGTMVSVASYGMHHDDTVYDEAEALNPFRFSDMREKQGESIKHQMVAPDNSYLVFGNGRHMCPGRFFAVNELKALLGHVLVTYDIKFENDGGYPPDDWAASAIIPNSSAEVMFRKRVA